MQKDGNWNGEAAEETNATPRKRSHQSRGAQPVYHSSVPFKTALSLGTMLSAPAMGSYVTTARRHLFQEEIIIVINFIGRELCLP